MMTKITLDILVCLQWALQSSWNVSEVDECQGLIWQNTDIDDCVTHKLPPATLRVQSPLCPGVTVIPLIKSVHW